MPVTWFFLPPLADTEGRIPLIIAPDLKDGFADTPGYMLELVFGPPGDEAAQVLSARLTEILNQLPPDLQTPFQQQIAHTSGLVGLAVVKSTLQDLETWENNLRDLAGLLAEARSRTLEGIADALAHSDEDEPSA